MATAAAVRRFSRNRASAGRPEAWFAPAGVRHYEVHWKVVPLFVDRYRPADVKDTSRKYETTLAQGLDNADHTLEIVGEVPLRAVRVYRPPVL